MTSDGKVPSRLRNEVKDFVRVEDETDDLLIDQLVQEAVREADRYLNNDFETTTERLGIGDGSETSFTTRHKPVFAKTETVKLDGVSQTRDTDYTMDNTTGAITFTTAPEEGVFVTITYMATLPIPDPVKTWIYKRVARQYERRVEGLSRSSEDGIGSDAYGLQEFDELRPFRKFAGL